MKFFDHLPNVGARYGIESGGGFVEEKNFRRVHQPARDLQAPAHAPGECAHQGLREPRQIDGFEQLANQILPFISRDAVELGVDLQIFFSGQFGVGGERLGNHSDGIAHAVRVLVNVVAGDFRPTVGGRRQRGQHADESGLAGAIGPQ